MPRLFLYGTLKRNRSAAHRLAGQRFVTEARTAPRYRMFRRDWYPCLVEVAEGDGASIAGELWDVDDACLARLDAFEDTANNLFRRQPVELADPTLGPAEAYLYLGPVNELEDCGPVW